MMKLNKANMQGVSIVKGHFQQASSLLKNIALQATMMEHKNQRYFVLSVE
jgi:GH43 family beta-xylosidase